MQPRCNMRLQIFYGNIVGYLLCSFRCAHLSGPSQLLIQENNRLRMNKAVLFVKRAGGHLLICQEGKDGEVMLSDICLLSSEGWIFHPAGVA